MDLYHAYDGLDRWRAAASWWTTAGALATRSMFPLAARHPIADRSKAARTVARGCRLTHERPEFHVEGATEHVEASTPFGSLLRFETPDTGGRPRVVVVAPLSGHFATMLRQTVTSLLQDFDVYITDWHNARDIPTRAGRFGFDEYIQHVIDFAEVTGPGTHLLAVCQPCVPALAAAAVLADEDHAARMESVTLMAGPIDPTAAPTLVNEFAWQHSLEWFERHLICRVPFGHRGAMRRVYPGFVQVGAFMSLNAERHVEKHHEFYKALVDEDHERANRAKRFYDEYFAVLDMTAEFYLETIDIVFQRHLLANGELTFEGRAVPTTSLADTPILTVEGERDDMCAPGQTAAAHAICGRPDGANHIQEGVGHYGVFSGSRWQGQIYPVVRDHILAAA